jgi:hypothetical protein
MGGPDDRPFLRTQAFPSRSSSPIGPHKLAPQANSLCLRPGLRASGKTLDLSHFAAGREIPDAFLIDERARLHRHYQLHDGEAHEP